MKNFYLTIVVFFCTFFTVFSQDPLISELSGVEYIEYSAQEQSVTIESDEVELLNNIWLPDELGGIVPIEVLAIESQNKIYVYGNNRLIVLNSITNEKINSIDISSYGQYMPKTNTTQIKYEKEQRLAFNNQNLLFCATESQEVLVINVETDEILYTIPTPQGLNQGHFWIILKYYEKNDLLFWAINEPTSDSKLFVHDATNYNLIYQFDFNNRLRDIEFNSQTDVFYLSLTEELRLYNAINYSLINTIYPDGGASPLLYVFNQQNQIHKLFCFSKTLDTQNYEGIAVDGDDNFSYDSFDLPGPYNIDACYDVQTNSVCLAYGHGQWNINKGIYFMDADNYSQIYNNPITGYDMPQDIIITNSHKVFCGTGNYLRIIDIDNNYLQTVINYKKNALHRLVSDNDKVFITNTAAGSIEIFDTEGNFVEAVDVGGAPYFGCFNKTENKMYFYTKSYWDIINSKVYIFNTITKEFIKVLTFEHSISDLKYDEVNNDVYVSSYTQTDKIKIIDGETDEVLSQEIVLNHNYCREMFISNNNKLYCAVQNNQGSTYGVEIIDLLDFSILNYISGFGITNILNAHFAYNPDDNEIYISIKDYSYETFGKLLVIDELNNTLITTYSLGNSPDEILYNKQNNKIYIRHINAFYLPAMITTVNRTNNQIEQINMQNGIVDIEYSEYHNQVFACAYSYDGIIEVIDCSNDVLLDPIVVAGVSYRVKYNPTNDKLYVLVPFNFNNNKSFEIWSVDLSSFSLTQMLSGFQERTRSGMLTVSGDMTYDSENNSYYVVNGYSAVTYVNCETEKLSWFNTGWHWLSFPRLERYGNEYAPTIPVLERLNCFPCDVYMFYENEQPINTIKYTLENSQWTGGLQTVQSTKGYKLKVESTIETVQLDLYGVKLDPLTEITLYPNQDNWTGYFIDYPQYPKDCFDEDDWEKLTMIKTQYWTMVRSSTEPPYWYIKGKVTPFEYGDLVVLRTDDVHTMSWIASGEVSEPEEIPKTEYYTFDEQADYLPIFVQFDEASEVQEVAVKVEGEVRGAAVRDPGDTIVHVNAYLGGTTPGAPLEFETWNGYKSAPVEKTAYVVYNPRTKKKEKRLIYTGEAARYHWVSLKHGEVYVIPDAISDISCVPNPFNDKTNITFRLNESMQVWVEIFDMSGKKINTLLQGELPGGYYNTTWNGDNEKGSKVNKGVYFYKIRTNFGTFVSEKIVLIK